MSASAMARGALPPLELPSSAVPPLLPELPPLPLAEPPVIATPGAAKPLQFFDLAQPEGARTRPAKRRARPRCGRMGPS